MTTIRTEVYEDADQLARSVAERVITIVDAAINARGSCAIALAGGSTPKRLYDLLASDEFRDRIDWTRTQLFLGDERFVPPDHPDSNFRMAKEALINHVPVPESQTFPVRSEMEPDAAASHCEKQIRANVPTGQDGLPVFDLILLGIGDDGHTASLFPGTNALAENNRLVVANDVPQQESTRITFTIPLLQAANETIVLATGAGKAEAVAKAIEGPQNIDETPCQILRESRGAVTFALDREAAAGLST